MAQDLSIDVVVRALSTVAGVMNASLDQQSLLTNVLRATVEALNFKAASIRLLNIENQTLEIQATVGLSKPYLAKGPVAVDLSPVDQQVLLGQTVVVDDILQNPGWQYPDEADAEGIRSVIAVPLRIQNRYLGVMRVYTDELHTFTENEQLLIAAIGNLVARAMRNTRFYHALHGIVTKVNSSLELTNVLPALMDSVVEEMNCKAASIRLLSPKKKRLHLVATHGLSEKYVKKGVILVDESPIDRKVLQGISSAIYDVQTEPGFQYPQEATAEGIRSVLAVPLTVRGEVIGVLRVYSAQLHRFNEDEVGFLESVAAMGAIAIDNARLYEVLKEKYKAARDDWAGWYRYLAFS